MGKAKIKVVSKKLVDDDMAEMFNQLIGTSGTVNLEFAWPRYLRLKKIAAQSVKLVSLLNSIEYLASDGTSDWVTSCNNDIEHMFSIKDIGQKTFIQDIVDYSEVTEANTRLFTKSYESCKKSQLFKVLCKWSEQLKAYATTINTDYSTLKPGQPKPHVTFAVMAGSSWYPLDPLNMNIKRVFVECNDESTQILTINILKKLLDLCNKCSVELRSPDIDVKKFAGIIVENIDKLKKVPELSRCDGAFSKIKKSIGLLENNFSNYYSDFIETSDSTIIMQNFVVDVAKNTKADVKTMQQFRKIMVYYRKLAASRNTNDPKINSLFDKIEEKFGSIDRDNIDSIEESSE